MLEEVIKQKKWKIPSKFEFEFDNVRTMNVFHRFEIRQMF